MLVLRKNTYIYTIGHGLSMRNVPFLWDLWWITDMTCIIICARLPFKDLWSINQHKKEDKEALFKEFHRLVNRACLCQAD
jgi:hypothetical protein